MSERTYHVWVEIEAQEDGEPLPPLSDNLSAGLPYAATMVETSVEGAERTAAAMHTFGAELGNLLELWGRRPSMEYALTEGDLRVYDEDVATWREELEATIGACMAPVLTEGAHT